MLFGLANSFVTMSSSFTVSGVVSVGGRSVFHRFYAVPNLCSPMLWGTDLLEKLELSIDFSKGGICYENNLIASWYKPQLEVVVDERCVVEPNCRQVLAV